jgi:hypothetical protein
VAELTSRQNGIFRQHLVESTTNFVEKTQPVRSLLKYDTDR